MAKIPPACFTITRYNAGISLSTRAGARVHASRGVHRHRASSSASPPPLLLLLLFSSRRSVHLVFVPFVIEPMKRSSSKNGILRGSFFLLFFGKIELTASTIHFQEKKKEKPTLPSVRYEFTSHCAGTTCTLDEILTTGLSRKYFEAKISRERMGGGWLYPVLSLRVR